MKYNIFCKTSYNSSSFHLLLPGLSRYPHVHSGFHSSNSNTVLHHIFQYLKGFGVPFEDTYLRQATPPYESGCKFMPPLIRVLLYLTFILVQFDTENMFHMGKYLYSYIVTRTFFLPVMNFNPVLCYTFVELIA